MTLFNYDYEPDFKPRITKAESEVYKKGYPVLTFGIENEVTLISNRSIEDAKARVSEITDLIDERFGGFIYCKHDGTTCDYSNNQKGFEIVTQPFSLAWLNEPENYRVMVECLSILESSGFIPNENCGMHVHVSKDVITDLNIYKIHEFFKNNPNAMFLLSGRSINPKSFGFYKDYASPVNGNSKRNAMQRSSQTKYSAIRFDKPNSAEFRLFGATLSPTEFMGNIEFAYALPLFCRDNSLSNVCIESFISFVKNERKNFKNLYNKIKRLNLDASKVKNDQLKYSAMLLKDII